MANNYYDATGVLVLDQVTPVITALFGGLKLDASYPGNGEVYIAQIAEDSGAHWDDVCEDLVALAQSLGLSVPSEGPPTMDDVLAVLSRHFGTDQDEDLQHLIEHHRFEDDSDLDALFLIATRLDDGHGLVEALGGGGALLVQPAFERVCLALQFFGALLRPSQFVLELLGLPSQSPDLALEGRAAQALGLPVASSFIRGGLGLVGAFRRGVALRRRAFYSILGRLGALCFVRSGRLFFMPE